MGSPLGVAFANFYMTHIENTVFDNNPSLKPRIYCRYIDDCFLLLDNANQVHEIIRAFQESSVLTFIHEIGLNNTINFLDVAIDNSGNSFSTTTYKKPTNPGHYINSISECPFRYKENTIKALINRTYKIASDENLFSLAIDRLKQTFINKTLHLIEFFINFWKKPET